MPDEDKQKPGVTRRRFLTGAAAAIAGFGVYKGAEHLFTTGEVKPVPDPAAAPVKLGTPNDAAHVPQPDRAAAEQQDPTPQQEAQPKPSHAFILGVQETEPALLSQVLSRLYLSDDWKDRSAKKLPRIMLNIDGLKYKAPGMGKFEIGSGSIEILDLNKLPGGYAVYLGGPRMNLNKPYKPHWKIADSQDYNDKSVFATAKYALDNAYTSLSSADNPTSVEQLELDKHERDWSGKIGKDITPQRDFTTPEAKAELLTFFLGEDDARTFQELMAIPGMVSTEDSTNMGKFFRKITPEFAAREKENHLKALTFFLGKADAEEYMRMADIAGIGGVPFFPSDPLLAVDDAESRRKHLKEEVLPKMRERANLLRTNSSLTEEQDRATGVGNPDRYLEDTAKSLATMNKSLWKMKGREAQFQAIARGDTTQEGLDALYNQLQSAADFVERQAKDVVLNTLHTSNVSNASIEVQQRIGFDTAKMRYETDRLESKTWQIYFDDKLVSLSLSTYPSKVPIPTREETQQSRLGGK